jgi:hypothetical protein
MNDSMSDEQPIRPLANNPPSPESLLEAAENRVRLEHAGADCIATLERYMRERRSPVPTHTTHVDLTALQACIGTYVRALKKVGEPPEATVRMVKEFVRSADGHRDDLRALTDAAVRWAISAYFSDELAPG